DLILVTEDGKYHLIDIFYHNNNNDESITLSESVSSISEARIFNAKSGSGLIALKRNHEGFIVVKNVYDPIIQTISIMNSDVRSNLTITAWCVIDHIDTTIAYACDNMIYTCNHSSSKKDQQQISGINDTIIKMVTSFDYQTIAVLKQNGDVLIGSKSLTHPFTLKFNGNNEKTRITDIAWCGNEAIIAIRSTSTTWYDLLILDSNKSKAITPTSREIITSDTLYYTTYVWLFPELDGVRILSGDTLQFFQRVPKELYNVLQVISEEPGAQLYNAYINYK
ncbi:unnamed protein product, partial [Didymodactylos carnosus]